MILRQFCDSEIKFAHVSTNTKAIITYQSGNVSPQTEEFLVGRKTFQEQFLVLKRKKRELVNFIADCRQMSFVVILRGFLFQRIKLCPSLVRLLQAQSQKQ